MYIVIETRTEWTVDHYSKHPQQGHGWQENVVHVKYFDEYESFLDYVTALKLGDKKFRAFDANEYKVTSEVKVNIE